MFFGIWRQLFKTHRCWLMASCNPNLAILSHNFYIFYLSIIHVIKNVRKTKKGEKLMVQEILRLVMARQSFLQCDSFARQQCGKICFKKKRVKDDWTTQSVGGRERGSKGYNRFLYPFRFCFKKRRCLYFPEKVDLTQPLKKSFKNRKIQNIMMTWTVQCIREDKNCVQMKCTNFL